MTIPDFDSAEKRHQLNKRRLLIDLSSIARACHHVGKDMEFGVDVVFEEKHVWVNSGRYLFNNFVSQYKNVIDQYGFKPYQTVLVLDGKDSRRLRRMLYPEYKAHRAARPPELNVAFNEGIALIKSELKALGGTVMVQDFMETDDVIAYLSTELEGSKMIWSRDADFLALHSESVSILLKDELNPVIHEAAPAKYVRLYKALCGDASDGFHGAKGFGPGAFTKLVLRFGDEGLDFISELIQQRSLDQLDIDGFAPLQKVIDCADSVYTAYACASFYPHRVNTSRDPLSIETGKVEQWDPAKYHYALKDYFGTKLLLNQANFLSQIDEVLINLRQSPWVALDIETSATDEGEAWGKKIDDSKKGKKSHTVDVFGSQLTSMILTFGDNLQHTVYMPVDHADRENNLSLGQLKGIVDSVKDKLKPIQNTAFELPVLFNTWGEWLPNAIDTVDMKSAIDETTPLGLKQCSKMFFDYDQMTYAEVTQGRRMNQLTAQEAFDYGCDDPICTSALFNRYEFTMELEKTYDSFRQCELASCYWVAESYVRGIDVDLVLLKQLEEEDDIRYDVLWAQLREYLFTINWKGTTYTPYELTPAAIKEVFEAITGRTLDCRARLPEKLAQACIDQGLPEIAEFILNDDVEGFNDFIQEGYWEPEPEFDLNKKTDLRTLMYDTLGLPIRFRTRVTETQKAKGVEWGQGTPQCDNFAIEHALKLDTKSEDDAHKMLLIIREMNQINTRHKLYYKPYPLFAHWKDGKIHASLGKNFTATRRFASNNPNLSQLPKKGAGIKIRDCIVAPEGYLLVSLDFASQELRVMAEVSGDTMLTSCFVGDSLKDPHALTGAGIALRNGSVYGDYDLFMQNLDKPEVKGFRASGKGTNFATGYLCRAPKLAKLLTVPVEESQIFLDAKNSVYTGLAQWQQDTIAESHAQGYITTMLGARRHLHAKLSSPEKWISQEAERQGVNFVVQGSSGEMTKCAVNSMWMQDLSTKYGIRFLFPVHDETDTLVPISQIYEAIPAIHACMVQPYGGMKINLESEIKIGFNFGRGLVKVGTEPTEENIRKAMIKLGLEQGQANAEEIAQDESPEFIPEDLADETPVEVPYR